MSPETADPKQPEPERRVATQLLRRLMELAPDAIIVLDSGQRVLFASEQTGRVFGYQQDERVACQSVWISSELIHPTRAR